MARRGLTCGRGGVSYAGNCTVHRDKTRPAPRASYKLRTDSELATWQNVLYRTPTVVIAMLIWVGAPPVDTPPPSPDFSPSGIASTRHVRHGCLLAQLVQPGVF